MSVARWRDVPFPGPDFHFGVWGDGQGRVWVVGQPFGGRTGLHRSDDGGATWTAEPRPNTQVLRAVTGTPGGVVWAVGDAGTVLRRRSDRDGWTRVRAGLKGNLLAVHVRGAAEVYVADAEGAVHRSTDGGTKWATVARSGGRFLRSIHGRSHGPLFAAGDAGLVLTSDDGAAWRPWVPDDGPLPRGTQHRVWVSPVGVAWLAGEGGLLRRAAARGPWEVAPVPPGMGMTTVTGNDAGLLLATTHDAVAGSTDGGATWAEEFAHPDPSRHRWFYDTWLDARGAAVAAGPHGTIRVREP